MSSYFKSTISGFKGRLINFSIMTAIFSGCFACGSLTPLYPLSDASAAQKDSREISESDSLGLIIKSIEMVEEKPLVAAIFNIKTGKTIEYTLGDYIDGRLVRDILEDRVVLYDEITRHQFVLIYNDVVSAEESEEKETSLIRIKEKKRDLEEMNVTNVFNMELSKVQGKEPSKFGVSDSQAEEEAKQKMNNYIRNFKDNPDGFKTQPADASKDSTSEAGVKDKNAPTVEVEVKDKKEKAATGEVEVKSDAKTASGTAETELKKAAAAEPEPKTSGTPANETGQKRQPPPRKPTGGPAVENKDKKKAGEGILNE